MCCSCYSFVAAAALLSASAFAQTAGQPPPASAAPGVTTCRTIHNGVEYRAYFPDRSRYVYVRAATLRGMDPSVLVIIDKNYDSPPGAAAGSVNPQITDWWIDRTQPFRFSTDTIKAFYEKHFSIGSMFSSIFSARPPQEFTVPIRGLRPAGTRFEGTGSGNTNTYAFEMRVDFPSETSDEFGLSLPAVTFGGVTVTPPVLHFTRSPDDSLESTIKC